VETLKSGAQRMFGIVAMNDKTEGNYVDEYIGFKRTRDRKNDYINRFILSCCDISLEDDLTMFCMYGDDARGVCINLISLDYDELQKLLSKKCSSISRYQ